MKRKSTEQTTQSWFWRHFLNNQVVISLVILLLILINLYIFTKISHIFSPIGDFVNIVAFPIVASGILYYLFSPIVERLYRRGIDKNISIFGIFILIILLITWGVMSLYPLVQQQTTAFITNIPSYMNSIDSMIKDNPIITKNPKLLNDIAPYLESFDLKSMTERLNSVVTTTFGGLGSFLGTLTQVVAGLVTIPIILYYLLKSNDKIPEAILYYIPTKYRAAVSRMMYQGNYQISQYIRGQIIVAIAVGIMFSIGYSIIGLDYAITFGVVSGILNIIPYAGSIIAAVPALIIGLLTSPIMLVKVIVVLMIEQTIEGRFISPQVLGNSLKIHPVTILLVLLAGGKLFGLPGVILGVPGYAVLKVIVSEVYSWYRESSSLYDDEVVVPLEIIEDPFNEKDEEDKGEMNES